jgi:REP element-mobilizing transposase RayT
VWLGELIVATCAEHGWSVAALAVMADHGHLAARYDPDTAQARLAHHVTGATRRALHEMIPDRRSWLPTKGVP